MRLRTDTCRAVLLTSLIWLVLDVYILFYYLDSSPPMERNSLAYKVNPKFDVVKQKFDENSVEGVKLKELLSQLNFDDHGAGDMGTGVNIPAEKQEEMKEMFKQNQFNLMASNMISIKRSLPDYRSAKCRTQADTYRQNKIPKTSIIIVFHNEAFSTLLRTLHSIINRSPLDLIEEIILIDDLSERDYLKGPLEMYIKTLPITMHLVHLPERSGLIRARLHGSGMAKGKVLLFLDAHVEVTEGWLEPLLHRVATDRKTVVAPIIDVISDDNFEYVTASDTTWGGFNWHLNFRWYQVPEREMQRRNNDRSTPIQTPTIAGGLFAIDKDFFYEIGSYDEGMQVWGGENLEISFRTWMCGGRLEIHPCSRVGHVFRKQTPYTFPGGTAKVIYHNAARTAHVWMDDYKRFFFAMVPGARKVETGDMNERHALRKNLECKSFKWYLENIYPEAPIPASYTELGQLKNAESGTCADTMGRKSGQQPALSPCHGLGGNQVWVLTESGEIRSDELCLSVRGMNLPMKYTVKLEKCLMSKISQWHRFEFDKSTGSLKHIKFDKCVEADSDGTLFVNSCSDSPKQKWTFEASTKY
ncbi:unnamed protein product [Bursaphelenchus okinawaensis]|uniref:Polypeptide N-acetylgalactosaminyltransferase n=1 Tax=Bursaphelenchus okinawaensis TaxID=465554 RepID=A0A811KG54_9BILA|nr:unnamed protein product [Bursaphelenchus okinawaensis]CAG9102478.1 unnamed protein product [Bursaphelenchus okinawaensis]